ncbi:MAG: 16S rRNA (guanine(527)-N(7))-methyltransferase RsmG [Deltaproteobacteria bacterium]
MRSEEMLTRGALELGIELTEEETRLFMRYLDMIKLWNRKVNLTGLKDEKDIIISHFLDSISASSFIEPGSRVLDIGSGAGFPGIPVKIVYRGVRLTLIDSVQKKVVFIKELIRELRLRETAAVWGRAEDEDNGIKRESFDCVISRAVGGLSDMLDLSAPYLATGGKIVLMRGRRGEKELETADEGIKKRFRIAECKTLKLPYGGQTRVIFAIEPLDAGTD